MRRLQALLRYASKIRHPVRTVRRIRNRLLNSVLVLGYHRIANLDAEPVPLAVTPKNFSQQMEVLRKLSLPISTKEFLSALRVGHLPRRAVVVTFDDGYLDNLLHAKPILARLDVPAVVFVASGFMQGGKPFWWDALERTLLRPGSLPQIVEIRTKEFIRGWDLGEAAHYSADAFRRLSAWRLESGTDPTMRHTVYRELYGILQTSQPDDRQAIVEQLIAMQSARDEGTESRPMTALEVARLADGALVDVGSHTVTHSNLLSLPQDIQRREVRESKAALEEVLGRPVTTFSYPFGFPGSHYTDDTTEEVRQAGYSCAFSAFLGVARNGKDPYQLPRAWVGDWDGETFERRLAEWFSK
jgi:peptidoglycan/xylan/chitin deacetylase (PgdA/CDA1 family)